MLMDAKKMSELIRNKKKKIMESDPEVVDTDARPDMTPMDVHDMKMKARIEDTIDAPHKINAEDTAMDESDSDAMTAGLTAEEKTRMGRLRKYMDNLETW